MLSNQIELVQMICGICGCVFAIPEFMRAEAERDGGSWYCPNGHPRTYRETKLQKTENQLATEREEKVELYTKLGELKRKLREAERKIRNSKKSKKK